MCSGTNVPFPEEHEKEPKLTDLEKWPIEEWRDDVARGDTKLGYLEWVRHQEPGQPRKTVVGADFKKILREFVGDIDATGGVFRKGFRSAYEGTETCAPVGAKDWTDLGETYLKACKALKRRPHVDKED